MAWIAIGVTAGSAVLGAKNADDQQRAQGRHNKAAAEHNRYSNWTGRSMDQKFGAQSTMGGFLGGGLAGFGASKGMMGGSGGGDPEAPIPEAPIPGGVDGGAFKMNPTGSPMKSQDPYTSMLKRGQDPRDRNLFGN